jgi:putative membrane protein
MRDREELIVMMFWYGNASWPFWEVALMWAGMIAFWGLLIWAVYALITGATRRTGAGTRDGKHNGNARRILDERLARGEIDSDEYQRRSSRAAAPHRGLLVLSQRRADGEGDDDPG